jgi:hypothetical protein
LIIWNISSSCAVGFRIDSNFELDSQRSSHRLECAIYSCAVELNISFIFSKLECVLSVRIAWRFLLAFFGIISGICSYLKTWRSASVNDILNIFLQTCIFWLPEILKSNILLTTHLCLILFEQSEFVFVPYDANL